MKLLALITLSFACLFARGQQFYLRGQVKDDKGKELPAVRIRSLSTGAIFQSGAQGYFGIILSRSTDTLQFSMFGYKDQWVPVNTKDFTNIVLNINEEELLKAKKKLVSRTENLKVSYDDIYHEGNETY